jgi:hypothetical protein
VLSSLPIAHEDSGTEDPRWVDKGGLQNIGRLGHFLEEFQILWNLSLIQKKINWTQIFPEQTKSSGNNNVQLNKKKDRKI